MAVHNHSFESMDCTTAIVKIFSTINFWFQIINPQILRLFCPLQVTFVLAKNVLLGKVNVNGEENGLIILRQ
jgi:hypothetical protein